MRRYVSMVRETRTMAEEFLRSLQLGFFFFHRRVAELLSRHAEKIFASLRATWRSLR